MMTTAYETFIVFKGTVDICLIDITITEAFIRRIPFMGSNLDIHLSFRIQWMGLNKGNKGLLTEPGS